MRHINPSDEHALQTRIRLDLLNAGYLRPLTLQAKTAWIKEWNTADITPDTIRKWPVFAWGQMDKPALTTGLQPATNGHNIVWIDSDVSDARGAAKVIHTARRIFGSRCVGDMPMRHSGRSTFALLLRTDKPLPYARTQTYMDAAGDSQKVELFGESASKQMAVFGPHTYSTLDHNIVMTDGKLAVERDYGWGERTPLNTPPGDLPYVSSADISRFLHEVDAVLRNDGRYRCADPVDKPFSPGAASYLLRNDTIIETARFGAVKYTDLVDLCLTQGDIRCSMSFLSTVHTNKNKGIASTKRDHGYTYAAIYDFEAETTHRHFTLDPGFTDSVRLHINAIVKE